MSSVFVFLQAYRFAQVGAEMRILKIQTKAFFDNEQLVIASIHL